MHRIAKISVSNIEFTVPMERFYMNIIMKIESPFTLSFSFSFRIVFNNNLTVQTALSILGRWMVQHRHIQGSLTKVTWPLQVRRSRPSTLQHLASVFIFLHFRYSFRKTTFSVTENAVLVWTVGQTGEKRCVFKFNRISVDRASDFDSW